jgi:hypothetical protein
MTTKISYVPSHDDVCENDGIALNVSTEQKVVVVSCPGYFTKGKEPPVHILYKAGCDPEAD